MCRADVDRERAARDEAAARGRIDRRGGESLAHLDPVRLETCLGVGRRGEQQPRVRVERVGQHILDRPLLDDLAGVHHENVVGDVARTREIVRDVEERDLPLLLELEHQVQDPDANRDVEHARRLVRQEHHRLDSQRARDRDSLALSAGELVGVLVRHVRGRHETDGAQQLVHTVLDLVAIDDAVDPKRTLEVVPDRLHRIERAEWILEDHLHLRPVAEHRPPAPVARDVATAVDDASAKSGDTGARSVAPPCSCRCRSRRRVR